MKVLEVQSLISGIDQTLNCLNNQENQMQEIESAIKSIVFLEQSLKGYGGQSIRSFYQEQHLSFIAFYQQTIDSYKESLKTLKNELLTLESNQNGFIHESFLQNELRNGLNRLKVNTMEMTDEANSIVDAVSDIVSLPRLQEEHFLQQLSLANQNVEQTLEKLHAFDSRQTNNLVLVEPNAERMKTYIQDMQTMFQKGSIKVDSYSKQLIEPIETYENMGAKKIHSEEDGVSSEIEIDLTTPFTGSNLFATTSEGAVAAHTAYRALHGYQVIRKDGKVKITDGKPIQRQKNPPGRKRATHRIYENSYIESQMKRGNYIKAAEFSGVKGAAVGAIKNKLTPISIGIDVFNDTKTNIEEGATNSKIAGDILGSIAVGVGTTAVAAGLTIAVLPAAAGVVSVAVAGFAASVGMNILTEGVKFNTDKNKDGEKDSIKDVVKFGFGEAVGTVAGWLK